MLAAVMPKRNGRLSPDRGEDTMTQFASDRLPLVIGITGHRDLHDRDVPLLEQTVASVIEALRRDFLAGDSETPVIVLSGLAEGADRVAARAALAAGAKLVAPLPMPLAEYRRDFEPGLKTGNITEFEELFAQAIAAPVMPLRIASVEALRDSHRRADQYRALGIFIARHCHVLLALWDGNGQDVSPGGAAEVVALKRDGIPLGLAGSARECLEGSGIGPVIEILTPRMKHAHAAREVSVKPWGKEVIEQHDRPHQSWRAAVETLAHSLAPGRKPRTVTLPPAQRREIESWQRFEALVGCNRQFNRDAEALLRRTDGARRMEESLVSLFEDGDAVGNDWPDARRRVAELAPLGLRFHAMADALAQERGSRLNANWKLLSACGLVGFVCFALVAQAASVASGGMVAVLLGGYFVCLVAALVLIVQAGRERHWHLVYRALAEALRVAVFWKLLGITPGYVQATSSGAHDAQVGGGPAQEVADAGPIRGPGELAWVTVCLRTLEGLDKPQGTFPHALDPIGHAIARRFWVLGQSARYGREASRQVQLADRHEACAAALIALSLLVLAPQELYLLLAGDRRGWLAQAIVVLIGLLPAMAAALIVYSGQWAFRAHARQCQRLHVLFERALDLLPVELDDETQERARSVYHQLGLAALSESAQRAALPARGPALPPQ
jgi:hypothetical protein